MFYIVFLQLISINIIRVPEINSLIQLADNVKELPLSKDTPSRKVNAYKVTLIYIITSFKSSLAGRCR